MSTKDFKVLQHLLLVIAVFTSFASCSNKAHTSPKPKSLEISEGFTNPLGFYDDSPSFSWKLPASVHSQSAYSIVVASSPDLLPNKADLWESGKVSSDQTLFVNYEGSPLSSRQKVYWQVQYWDEVQHVSQWSDMGHFELALLNINDWQAQWINAPKHKIANVKDIKKKIHPVQYFRKEFDLKRKVKQARLYITAKGLFEAQINGQKVGRDVLAPGWTPYQKRIETLTYDVTSLVQQGDNAMGLELAEGWHSGRLLFRGYSPLMPQVLAQLEVVYSDGSTEIVATDKTWLSTSDGPTRYSSIYDGEFYDANKEFKAWSEPGFSAEAWSLAVSEAIADTVMLQPKRHSTVRTTMEVSAKSITEPVKGKFVFDLGQNMAGVPSIKLPVIKGQVVKIRFAEMLQSSGEIYTRNYRNAVSTDFYMPAKDGIIEWQPKFTFHGFRYVELSGFDDKATPETSWVTGLVQHSEFEKSGDFKSSHAKLNQLQSNIEWGLRGNFLDIPTDCPQRNERLGWTGDAQVFIPTSLFIADVHSFWSAWMQSVREDQEETGAIPVVIPNVGRDKCSSGWGDVATIIPWETYWRTGDVKILEDSYDCMKGWIGYYASQATDHIVAMDTYGDWLQPYSKDRKGETDKKLINTAYYAKSIAITLETAKVLELNKDVLKLQQQLNAVKLAFQNHFFNEDATVSKGMSTQTAYLLAIGFDLLTPEMKEKASVHLLTEVEKADNHLRTGFLGTPLLAPVLQSIGRSDLMFEMLFKETYPSWFYSINQGATTMWERWDSYTLKDGFNKEGMNSFNHYAYGAIGQWMYESIAGIKPLEAGYKKILIAPVPGEKLTFAQASYDSPYGLVSSAWQLENDVFTLGLIVPPNTTAKVIIPASDVNQVQMNGKALMEVVKTIIFGNETVEFEIQSGTYDIKSTLE